MRQRRVGLGGQRFPEPGVTAARDSNIPILEHWASCNTPRRVWKIEDRNIDFLPIESSDHLFAYQRYDAQINPWRNAAQMRNERHDDGRNSQVDGCDCEAASKGRVEDPRREQRAGAAEDFGNLRREHKRARRWLNPLRMAHE